MSFQVTLALYCAITCWRQNNLIKYHLSKLVLIRKDYQNLAPAATLDYTIYRYGRLALLQRANFILSTLGAVMVIGTVTWIRWRLANNIPISLHDMELTFPTTLGMALLDQSQYLVIYCYFVICIFLDLLPPIK